MKPYKLKLERITEDHKFTHARLNPHIAKFDVQVTRCDHVYDNNDVVYHVFSDHFDISVSKVKQVMFRYFDDYKSELSEIVDDYLEYKGMERFDYIVRAGKPHARADQLCIYILARAFTVHVALICKDYVWYTFTGNGNISDCKFIFIYTGGNTWKVGCKAVPRRPLSSAVWVSKPKRKRAVDEDPDYNPVSSAQVPKAKQKKFQRATCESVSTPPATISRPPETVSRPPETVSRPPDTVEIPTELVYMPPATFTTPLVSQQTDYFVTDVIKTEPEEVSETFIFPEAIPVIDLISDEDSDHVVQKCEDSHISSHIIPGHTSDTSDNTIIYEVPVQGEENILGDVTSPEPVFVDSSNYTGDSTSYIDSEMSSSVVGSPDSLVLSPASQKKGKVHVVPQREFKLPRQRKSGKLYKCGDCSKTFKFVTLRNVHIASVHGKVFKCHMCAKMFISKETLNRHKRAHKEENKKYCCSKCDFKCLHASGLQLHMASHSRVKNFHCDWRNCDKSYYTKGELTYHVRQIHTTRLLLQCPECPKKCYGNKNLKQHMKVHEPPTEKCKYCGALFRYYQQLKNHNKYCNVLVE